MANAQPAAFELRPVTVTGSGMPRTLGSEIAATSVLTRGDIERSGATDVVSVLNLLGTALVEQQGGPGTLAAVRIRGAEARDTLVLIDGVPLTDLTTGQASLWQLPADWIERVEVVRGNMSPLYGANATGGVIHIFTRRGASGPLRPQLSVGGGSHGTRRLGAGVGGGSDALRARLTVGTERTDGFSAADPAIAANANPDDDGNRRDHAALAFDSQLSHGHRIGLDLRYLKGRGEYDSTSPFSAAVDTHSNRIVQRGATLRGEHAFVARWALRWRVADADEKRTDAVVTASGLSTFGNVLHNRILAADLNGSLVDGWSMQLGLERLSQSTENTTYTQRSRDTDTVRLGSTYDAAWGALQANLRHDRTSDFGAATTGLIGGKLALGGGFSGLATVSTGFTPPTLDYLFFDCSPFGFVCSNPNLKPEKARTVEAGVQWEDARTLVRATVFAARYSGKIANDLFFVPQNLNRARNKGLELAARTKMASWHLVAEATLQNPVDEATGERLIRRAKQQLAVRADYEGSGWGAGAGLRHVGTRVDNTNTFPATRTTLPSYTVFDASARWTWTPEWVLQGTLENVFDRSYQPTSGYNGRPRGLFVGINWQPKP